MLHIMPPSKPQRTLERLFTQRRGRGILRICGHQIRPTKDRVPTPRDPARERWASPKRGRPYVSLAHYETPRRSSTSAPTPEAISVREATKVTGPTSDGPPVVGSGVAVAVGLAVAVAMGEAVAVAVGLAAAVAVAMGLAVMAPPYCCANAVEASSRTSTALIVNRSKTFFIKHPL